VYTLPGDYEPIVDNLGISQTTDFEPIRRTTRAGNVFFEQVAPLPPPPPAAAVAPVVEESYSPIRKPPATDATKKPTDKDKKEKKSKPAKDAEEGNSSDEDKKPSGAPAKPKPSGAPAKPQPGQYPPLHEDVSVYNVFDPRFSGYGADDRHYLHPTLGQIRYDYADVDAVRRPNYIVRSKIDSCVTQFGDGYGPQRVDQRTLNENRALAEQAYVHNHLAFRNDLQESLMRKRNSEMWQVRQGPKYTTRQR
jgi:hypothetical protein